MSLSSQRAGWSQPQTFQFMVLVVLTLVARVKPWGLEPRGPQSRWFLSCLLSWWSRRGLSEVSARSEQWGGMVCSSLGQNRRKPRSLVWFLVGFKLERLLSEQRAFISQTHKGRFRAVLDSAVIGFLMAWSQLSFWRPSCSAWAGMEDLRPLRNRRIKTGSKISVSVSNSQRTIYECSRWTA